MNRWLPFAFVTCALLLAACAPTAAAPAVPSATASAGAGGGTARGSYVRLSTMGTVPAGVGRGVVGIRIGTEGAEPGPAELYLYDASYTEAATDQSRVPDANFAGGMGHWGSSDPAMVKLEPSDRGSGQMLHLTDAAGTALALNSGEFAVTPGAAYSLSFGARLVPTTHGSLVLLFLAGSETSRVTIPLSPR